MKLGASSISLAVKDIAASRAFYEKLGFKHVLGDQTQNWLILRNGQTTVGLFQGMFTFNPGWNSQAQPLKEFEDIREIQRSLKASGLTLAFRSGRIDHRPGKPNADRSGRKPNPHRPTRRLTWRFETSVQPNDSARR